MLIIMDERVCGECGRPCTSIYGFCQKTVACRRALQREFGKQKYGRPGEPLQFRPCGECGEPTSSKWGFCFSNPDCRKRYHAVRRADQSVKVKNREIRKRYYAKHGANHRETANERNRRNAHDSVVYCVHLYAGRVKVGTTKNLTLLMSQYHRVIPEAKLVWQAPGGRTLEDAMKWGLPQEFRVRHQTGALSEVFDFGGLPLSGILAHLDATLKSVRPSLGAPKSP